MATDLKLFGPIDIDCRDEGAAKHIHPDNKKEFLRRLDNEGLSEKQGCYIFALRSGKGFTPWYVGKATKTMSQECMGSHQLNMYSAVFSEGWKGSPVMFFVSPEGNKNKVPAAICDEIETELIQFAHNKNPDLQNTRKAKTPEWRIEGVIRGTRKPTTEERDFRTMMGI